MDPQYHNHTTLIIPPDRAKPLAKIISINHNEQYFRWVFSKPIIVEKIRAALINLPRRLSSFELFCHLIRSYHVLQRQQYRSWEECAAIIVIGRMIGVMMEQMVAGETQTSQGQGRKTAMLKRVSSHTGLAEIEIAAVIRCDRFFKELGSRGQSAGFGKNSFGIFVFFDPQDSSK